MPAIFGQGRLYNRTNLPVATTVGVESAVELKPNPRSADTTQQCWAQMSWAGLTPGQTLTINVYNIPRATTPASAARERQLVATTGPVTAASGSELKFVEVAGPQMFAEAIVAGGVATTTDVTVMLQSTANVTLTPGE